MYLNPVSALLPINLLFWIALIARHFILRDATPRKKRAFRSGLTRHFGTVALITTSVLETLSYRIGTFSYGLDEFYSFGFTRRHEVFLLCVSPPNLVTLVVTLSAPVSLNALEGIQTTHPKFLTRLELRVPEDSTSIPLTLLRISLTETPRLVLHLLIGCIRKSPTPSSTELLSRLTLVVNLTLILYTSLPPYTLRTLPRTRVRGQWPHPKTELNETICGLPVATFGSTSPPLRSNADVISLGRPKEVSVLVIGRRVRPIFLLCDTPKDLVSTLRVHTTPRALSRVSPALDSRSTPPGHPGPNSNEPFLLIIAPFRLHVRLITLLLVPLSLTGQKPIDSVILESTGQQSLPRLDL